MAAVKPSPPPVPAGIVVVVLALVRVVLALTLALGRVLLVAAEALPYLGFATLWVISAAAATKVVGSRAWDEGSAPAVFLQALTGGALKVSLLVLQALGAVMLCGQFLLYVVAAVSGSGSEFEKRAHGAFNQELIRGGSSPHCSPWNVRVYALHPANFSWFSGGMHDVEKDWFCDCGCGDIWLQCDTLLCGHSSCSTE